MTAWPAYLPRTTAAPCDPHRRCPGEAGRWGWSRKSDVQEADVSRVAGDEVPSRVDVLAHEDREQLVRRGRVLERDLAERADRRVHGGLPQLLGVHLTEPLVALDTVVHVDLALVLQTDLEQLVTLAVGIREVRLTLAPLELVQRRLREVDVAVLHERLHEPEDQ